MGKKSAQAQGSEKYFNVLKIFHLAPDFKFTDYEKEAIKHIDEVGTTTAYDLADIYDLRPSEAKELIDGLSAKGVLVVNNGNYSLSEPALKYIHATKEERKTEKKFRKFLNTLDDKEIDKFMALVNSFEVKEVGVEPKKEDK